MIKPLPCCSMPNGEHTESCRTPIWAKMADDRKARKDMVENASGWDMYRLGIIHERNRIAAWLASDPYGQQKLNPAAWSVTLDYAEQIQNDIVEKSPDEKKD